MQLPILFVHWIWKNGFQKHLQYEPTCEQFYNEKPVATGQILDFSPGRASNNACVPNQTSYQNNRVAASGIVDTIQLNITDNNLSNMDFQTQLDWLNKMKDTATEPSGYMDTGRVLSFISNGTLPLNNSFQQNHQDKNSEIT